MAHYTGIQGTHFSFLPTQSKTGYECMLGSIEMGYNVEGFLLINQDTLINSWNFKDLDANVIWHGNEHAQAINNANIKAVDPPSGDKIMMSSLGILKSFEFLENVLLNRYSRSGKSLSHGHHHHDEVLEEDEVFLDLLEDRSKRSADDDDDNFLESEEELQLIAADHDKRKTDVMSITEDQQTMPMLEEKEWHINLFGEIIHDKKEDVSEYTNSTFNVTSETGNPGKFRNVSELLFHPSNFEAINMDDILSEMKDMDASEFDQMMFDIQTIYKKINSKLQLWLQFVSTDDAEEKHQMKEKLSGLQCGVSTNAEICQIVAHFFNTLEMNEADGQFKLYFDDLPIYYVPASHKDRLYLMANLFTK